MGSDDLTLRDLLHRAAEHYPGREAVADARFRYTYQELLAAVRRMAKLLHTRGVRQGDRMVLLMPPSTSHVIAFFGAVELGAIPCSLHVRESDDTLAKLVERLAPRVLVYDGFYTEKAALLRERVPLVTAGILAVTEQTPDDAVTATRDAVVPTELAEHELDFEPMPVAVDDTAVIALSSGTTSLPKGMMHTHRTLVASARNGAHYMDVTERTCAISPFATAFIGWYNMYLPFLFGAAKIVFVAQWEPRRVLQAIQDEQVTVSFLVPTMWRMLLQQPLAEFELGSLQCVGFAGEPMDPTTLARIRQTFCPAMINTYGTTETGSWGGCTVLLPDDFEHGRGEGSVGRAADGVEVRIVAPDGTVGDVLPAGEEGEVVISGPSVARQIWEQPDLARKVFVGRWWRSRDLGLLDADGYLYLRGRIDDMIISGGINVQPGEVEDVIRAHPAVAECVVIGLPSEQWGQQITAYVIPKADVTADELAAHVDDSALSKYKKPREYRFVDDIPRGNTGKVARRLLREQVLGD
ncbi:MAG: class I adenylate-forming enzyme family protein [Gammaproteobacteria bacterium]|nr:class I adenylate-forming enzyme family protein [Gammaproteobacteria bacterium]